MKISLLSTRLLFFSISLYQLIVSPHRATNSNVYKTWGAHTDKQFTHFDALTLALEMKIRQKNEQNQEKKDIRRILTNNNNNNKSMEKFI